MIEPDQDAHVALAWAKETPMTLPDNLRSLFALGAFCLLGGAWLTLATGIRTLPLRESNAMSAAPECTNGSATSSRTLQDFCASSSP